jgi:hypothetical protein
MHRFCALTPLFLIAATGFCVAAENPRTTTFSTPEGQASCPIAIEATWSRPGAATVPVNSGKSSQRTLHVTLRNDQPSSVSRTVITVYGFPVGTVSTPAVVYPLGQNPAEIGRSFTIARTIETGHSVSATFDIPTLLVVTGINLDGLEYAGTHKLEKQRGCQALSGGMERIPASGD